MKTGRPAKTNLLPIFNAARKRWMIDIPASLAGKRKRMFFSDRAAALVATAEFEEQIAHGSVVEVPKRVTKNTIEGLAAAYLSEREKDTGPDNLITLRWGLKLLCARFGRKEPQSITPLEIDLWMRSLTQYKTRSRFNAFASARTFYNSPLLQELVPINPFKTPPQKRDKNYRQPILTPEQMKKLLAAPFADFFKSWLVAGGFAGIRTCEYERLTYEAIDYDHKEIIIRKEESKGGQASRPRSITIHPVFARHMPRGTGPLDAGCGWKKEDKEMEKALAILGWKKWSTNALRHSMASYHLAHFKDAAMTAYELGNSVELIYSTYANAVSRKDAAIWFDGL